MEAVYNVEYGCWFLILDGICLGTAETEAEAWMGLEEILGGVK